MRIPSNARIVIIGGGVVGCSVAYHLTKIGITDIILLERGTLSCGTTWHSAGDIPLMKPTALLRAVRYGADLYSRLEEETGQSTGWRRCGYLKVARTPARLAEYKRSLATFRAFGGEAEIVTPSEAKELWPLMRTDDICGGVWERGSGRVDPTNLVMAYAKGARSRGAKIVEAISLERVLVEKGAVAGVATSAGQIKCEIVVNCAGLWARQIAQTCGASVPLYASEHFYMLTKPIPGVHAGLTILNDPDGHIYMREDVGGLLVGCFEPNAKAIALDRIPADFSFGRLEEDWDHVEPYLGRAADRIPALMDAQIRMLMNGPESFTPDGSLLIGETPEVCRFYVVAGCNSGGVALSGGLGQAMAALIGGQEPVFDISRFDIRRFGEAQNNDGWLRGRISEIVGRHMALHWPGKDFETGRGQRCSPLYHRLLKKGAVYGSHSGWERPLWFGSGEGPESKTFGIPAWLDAVAAEHMAVREGVAVFDLSSFAKFMFEGPEALRDLQTICTNEIDVPVGRVVYTALLDARGGFQSDLTVARLAPSRFMIVTGAAQAVRDADWIHRHASVHSVLTDVTSAFATLGVAGRYSRDLLSRLTDSKLDSAAFPFATCRWISVGPVRALAVRISFTGDLGWELYVPSEMAVAAYDAIFEAGTEFGVQDAGYHALGSLRVEKGNRSWGRELSPMINPIEAGLAAIVRVNKAIDFIGKYAISQAAAGPPKIRVVQFSMGLDEHFLYGDEPILRDGVHVGLVSSAGYSPAQSRIIGLGQVSCAAGVDDSFLKSGSFHLDVGGDKLGITLHTKPIFDPTGTRMRA
jgi:glycine cleavage system aminomethyltransferase T/glycine/D-amino acid oxidase-like deaminating enzyme